MPLAVFSLMDDRFSSVSGRLPSGARAASAARRPALLSLSARPCNAAGWAGEPARIADLAMPRARPDAPTLL